MSREDLNDLENDNLQEKDEFLEEINKEEELEEVEEERSGTEELEEAEEERSIAEELEEGEEERSGAEELEEVEEERSIAEELKEGEEERSGAEELEEVEEERSIAKELEEAKEEGSKAEELEEAKEGSKSEEQEEKQDNKKKSIFLQFKLGDKKPINKLSLIIYSTIGILVLLIVVLIIVFSVVLNNIKKQNDLREEQIQINFDELEEEESVIGRAININNQQVLDGQTITLSKMSLDSEYTYFYFSDILDTLKFDIYLVDQNNRLFSRDLTYNANHIDGYGTILRFESVAENSYLLKLYFVNNVTREMNYYSIILSGDKPINSVKFVNNTIKSSAEDFDILITNAIFSENSSRIDYIMERKGEEGTYTIQSGLDGNANMYLLENGKKLVNLRKSPINYDFSSNENLEFYRMDFAGVSSLKSRLVLCLTDLYKRYEINETVNYSEISGDNEKVIPFGKYNLVVEGLAKFNDIIVLVLHGEDTSIDNSENENANRFKTIVDVEATINTSYGMQVNLDGQVQASEIGTDVTFNISSEYSSFLTGISLDNVSINIKAVLVEIDDMYVNIDLEQAMARKIVADEELEDQILNAFNTRLLYKSGKIDFTSITGFDSAVLSDQSLMNDYLPQNTIMPLYSAQILFKGIYGSTLYYVIQENWKESVESTSSFYRTHMITLNKNSLGSWVIVSDKVIK